MLRENAKLEYFIEKPVFKTHIISSGLSNYSAKNVFSSAIPNTLYVFLISQAALNGSYNSNPLYLEHGNITHLRICLNGPIHTNLRENFTSNKISQFMGNTLANIGKRAVGLTPETFVNGKTLFVFDLIQTLSDDILNLHRNGNVRVEIQTENPINENLVLFTVGIFSQNKILINPARNVEPSFAM